MVATTEPVISVRDLRKTYKEGLFGRRKVHALNGVTFDVPRGSIFGMLGPNGAGKTTLIKLLLGIARRTGGSAEVLGMPAGTRQIRSRVGYLPENHRIPQHLTGFTALEYYGGLSGISASDVKSRRGPLLDRVGLGGRGTSPVKGYSKGMLQRLGLAQAMLHDPELIILDEPTDGVDPVGRREIRAILRELASEGRSVFLNSHLLQEIELICDTVVILNNGHVRKVASVDELRTGAQQKTILVALGQVDDLKPVIGEFHGSLRAGADARLTEIELLVQGQPEVDQMIDRIRAAGISLISLMPQKMTLEDAFIEIIGNDGGAK